MATTHLDHPGEWHWFSGYGPAEVLGPCPHDCEHLGQSVIAWGPDMEHYELVQCDTGCAGQCRAWTNETSSPRSKAEWLTVRLVAPTQCPACGEPLYRATDAYVVCCWGCDRDFVVSTHNDYLLNAPQPG